ncbi:MAG: sugar phosphate nucleotidyltransferase [Planctomycetota bacterium]
MLIKKAVITAAGPGQVDLPLQTVVDQSSQAGSALELLVSEVTRAGIEEVAIVVCPGQIKRYQSALKGYEGRLRFFEQNNPRGYGDALLRARDFTRQEPFLHLVSDHLYVTRNGKSCASQLLEIAKAEQCAVSAIQPTRENQLSSFGVIGGQPVAQKSGLFEVRTVLEKPTPTVAERQLIVPGQRAGFYLCLFGMHVLTPEFFDLLAENLTQLGTNDSLNISETLGQLAYGQRYLAAELKGERYDIGSKFGLLFAQLAMALAGDDRDSVLTELVELVAKR